MLGNPVKIARHRQLLDRGSGLRFERERFHVSQSGGPSVEPEPRDCVPVSPVSGLLDQLAHGVALFGPDKQLKIANLAAVNLIPGLASAIEPGAGLSDLLQAALSCGLIASCDGRETGWLRLAMGRLCRGGRYELELADHGVWLQIESRVEPDGGLLLELSDISALRRRQEVLSESAERYRLLSEQSLQGVLVHDGFEPLYINDRFARLFGFRKEELSTQKAIMKLLTADPRERADAFDRFEDHDGAPDGFISFSARRKDGAVIYLEGVSQDVNWSGLKVTQMALHDVTARTQAHAYKRTILDVMSAVAEAPGFHAALKMTIATVCRNLGFPYGSAWISEDGGETAIMRSTWHRGTANLQAFEEYSRTMALRSGEGIVGEAWATGRPRRAGAAYGPAGLRSLYQSKAAEHGLLTGLAVPVRSEGGVLAVLTFWMDYVSHNEDQALPEMIIAIASELGRMFERKHAEQALAESEARFRNLIEGSVQGVFIIGRDSRPVFANLAGARIFGYADPA